MLSELFTFYVNPATFAFLGLFISSIQWQHNIFPIIGQSAQLAAAL